jgi:hypothetical protein
MAQNRAVLSMLKCQFGLTLLFIDLFTHDLFILLIGK